MIRRATISECGTYRYDLTRTLTARAPTNQVLGVCMLNPSKADAEIDDPTITRLIGYANRERFAGIHVVNVYAYRATDSKELLTASNPRGTHNDGFLMNAAMGFEKILVGWGALTKFPDHHDQAYTARLLSKFGAKLVCLGVNKDGSPVHPLYQRNDAPFIPWSLPK